MKMGRTVTVHSSLKVSTHDLIDNKPSEVLDMFCFKKYDLCDHSWSLNMGVKRVKGSCRKELQDKGKKGLFWKSQNCKVTNCACQDEIDDLEDLSGRWGTSLLHNKLSSSREAALPGEASRLPDSGWKAGSLGGWKVREVQRRSAARMISPFYSYMILKENEK